MVAVTNLVDQAYTAVLAPVWAKESGAGVAVLGTLFAVMSGASVLGALTAARWGETLPRYRTYVIAFLICGAPRFVVMALESPLWAVFAVTVVGGVASGFLNPILGAVILERIPAPLLGRVSSLNTAMCWSLMPLGGVLGGLAVAGLGLSPALLVAGAAYFVTTMAPTRVPSFRQMDRAPAPSPTVSGSGRSRRARRAGAAEGSGRKRAATSTTRSLASASPMLTRTPSPANGRTDDAELAARGGEVEGAVAQREPDEVALRVGQLPADLAQPGDQVGAARDEVVDPLEQLVARGQRGDRRGLRDVADPERQRHRAQRAGDRRGRDGVPDPEAGEPVGLGEGAGEHDVVVAAVGRDAVDRVVHPDELEVGLVDHDDARARGPSRGRRRARTG